MEGEPGLYLSTSKEDDGGRLEPEDEDGEIRQCHLVFSPAAIYVEVVVVKTVLIMGLCTEHLYSRYYTHSYTYSTHTHIHSQTHTHTHHSNIYNFLSYCDPFYRWGSRMSRASIS